MFRGVGPCVIGPKAIAGMGANGHSPERALARGGAPDGAAGGRGRRCAGELGARGGERRGAPVEQRQGSSPTEVQGASGAPECAG